MNADQVTRQNWHDRFHLCDPARVILFWRNNRVESISVPTDGGLISALLGAVLEGLS